MVIIETLKQQLAEIFGVDYPSLTKTENKPYYEYDSEGKETQKQMPVTLDRSKEINAIATAIQYLLLNAQFTTTIPLVGGGVPGPVSGVEPPGNGWIS